MFERFTDRARNTIGFAHEEAKRLNHPFISTEHILLGLIKSGSGVAVEVLRGLSIDLEDVRRETEKTFEPGPEPVTGDKVPLTTEARKLIDFAIEERTALKCDYVGSEHLLLGLLRAPATPATQVLLGFGLDLEKARAKLKDILGIGGSGNSDSG
jgi:ATP-dependent Clp protease ATP-binding subunit ClpC